MGRTKIIIHYEICGDGNKIDPRECAKCLKECDPAVFLMHQTQGMEEQEKDPLNPQFWRITALYPSQCTLCFKCIDVCPENAISIFSKKNLFSKYQIIERRLSNV